MSRRISTYAVAAALGTLSLASACKRDDASAAPAGQSAMQVGPENIAVVEARQITSGPALSGTIAAEQEATVRAEVAGAVIRTMADVGQAVRAGQELARIDDTAIRDQYLSARSGVTMAQNNATVAEREVQRADALSKAGAIADRQVEQAKSALTGAQAQLADARARLSMAEQQLARTVIRAPFTGVVSVRSANAGDVVAPGGAMFTIVNPASMRLEASVNADEIAAVRPGAAVEFTVNGYPTRRFTGRISRVNPVADPATRQVRVTVVLPNQEGTLVGGLFAQGRVAAETRTGPVVPLGAIDESGVRPIVMRIKQGKVERVEVQLGLRDPTSEGMEIRYGLAVGDTVLLGAARGISQGTPVSVSAPTDQKPR